MGKSLIIEGGNFAANGIPDLASFVDISSAIEKSGTLRQYIHYPSGNLSETFQYNSALTGVQICSINVSAYVGKRLRLYARDSGTYAANGYYYKCFASAVTVTLPWTGTSTQRNVVTPVEHIDGKGDTTGAPIWFDLIVPTGAVYLIFTNNNTVLSNPRVLVEAA